jgi:hypothetical protein
VKEMATRFEQDVAGRRGRPPAAAGQPRQRGAGRTPAGPGDPDRPVHHHPGRHQRDSPYGGRPRADRPNPGEVPRERTDPLLVETADRIFADTCPAGGGRGRGERLGPAGLGGGGRGRTAVVVVAGDAGGSGGTLLDALEVLYLGRPAGVPLPLAETALLGGWLLTSIGHPLPGGPVTVVPGDPRDDLVLDGSRLREPRTGWRGRTRPRRSWPSCLIPTAGRGRGRRPGTVPAEEQPGRGAAPPASSSTASRSSASRPAGRGPGRRCGGGAPEPGRADRRLRWRRRAT